MTREKIVILDRPSLSWTPTWEKNNILQRVMELTETSIDAVVSVVCNEAVNRYVYAYPTISLGNASSFHGPDLQKDISGTILLSLNQKSYTTNLTIQFEWLMRSYEYQRAIIKKFLCNFIPVASKCVSKIPVTSDEFEDILQVCANLSLSNTHEFTMKSLKNIMGSYPILAISQYTDPISIIIEYINGGIFEYELSRTSVHDEILTAKYPIEYILEHNSEFNNYVCIRPAITHYFDLGSQ